MAYYGFYRQSGELEMYNVDWKKVYWEGLWREKIRERGCDIDCWPSSEMVKHLIKDAAERP